MTHDFHGAKLKKAARPSLHALLSDHKEATRNARMLCVILLALITAVTLVECLEIVILPAHVLRWLSIIVAVDALGLALLEVNGRGHTRRASILLVTSLTVIITICAATRGGINTPAATYYLTVVFIAGLLLGARWALVTAVLCCAGGLGLVYSGWKADLPPDELRHSALALWMGIVINMGIILGLQYFAARASRNALQQVRALSSRLVSLREEERTRIAREVHDHLGQLLTALNMEIYQLQTGVSGVGESELRTK